MEKSYMNFFMMRLLVCPKCLTEALSKRFRSEKEKRFKKLPWSAGGVHKGVVEGEGGGGVVITRVVAGPLEQEEGNVASAF